MRVTSPYARVHMSPVQPGGVTTITRLPCIRFARWALTSPATPPTSVPLDSRWCRHHSSRALHIALVAHPHTSPLRLAHQPVRHNSLPEVPWAPLFPWDVCRSHLTLPAMRVQRQMNSVPPN